MAWIVVVCVGLPRALQAAPWPRCVAFPRDSLVEAWRFRPALGADVSVPTGPTLVAGGALLRTRVPTGPNGREDTCADAWSATVEPGRYLMRLALGWQRTSGNLGGGAGVRLVAVRWPGAAGDGRDRWMFGPELRATALGARVGIGWLTPTDRTTRGRLLATLGVGF